MAVTKRISFEEMNDILLFIENNDFDADGYLYEINPEIVTKLIHELKSWRLNSSPG